LSVWGHPVVKDAFSDNDHRPPSPTDGLSREADDEILRSPAGNLTQELAQLLAASIAQNQANKGRSGTPTNAELTSLANLVSAAAAQRTLAPVFKDGLSALSYGQPRSAPAAQPTAAHLEIGHDDEPMPIPSTWRQPSPQDDDRWFRQQMGAAVVGLIAGLMIVVPAVLWLSGFFSSQKAGPTAAARVAPAAVDARAPPDAKTADVKTVRVQVRPMDQGRPAEKQSETAAQFMTGSVEPPRPAPLEAKPPLPPAVPVIPVARLVDPNKARIDELLAQAAQRIEGGDVIGAREILAGGDDGAQGSVSFALAETYDPNMLAAWGTRGVAADAAKARALYRKASSLGVTRAQNRLDALR
jgi:hypothetical protein